METERSVAEQWEADLANGDPLGLVKVDDGKPVETAEAVEPAEKVEAPKGFDPSALPEDARAEWTRMQEQVKKAEIARRELLNRVPALQRELAQKEKLLKQQKPTEQPKAPEAKPGQTAADYFQSPAWKRYQDTYPEEAEPILAAFRAQDEANQRRYAELESRVGRLNQFIDSELPKRFSQYEGVLSAHKDQELQRKSQELTGIIGDWSQHIEVEFDERTGETNITNLSDPMKEWMDRQPPAMLEMLFGSDVENVAAAFGAFNDWVARSTPAVKSPEVAKRESALSRRVGPAVKGDGVARGEGSDIGASFDLRLKQAQSNYM